jgi:cell division protein FtsZ
MGAAVDAALKDRLCVTLIAAKQSSLTVSEPVRTTTRGGFSTTTTSQREPVMPRGRAQRKHTKPVQTQLPLSIVSKGRFDKSEPTIHGGEDLDVPTFLRRGVAMN